MATDKEYQLLSLLAYYDFDTNTVGNNASQKGKTVGEIINARNREGAYIFELSKDHRDDGWTREKLEAIKDFTLEESQSNTTTGFSGLAVRDTSGKLVFAFRGTEFKTEPIKDGLIQDVLAIGAGLDTHNQFNDAEAFVRQVIGIRDIHNINEALRVRGERVSFTGHSLGGGIAEQMVLQTYRTGKTRFCFENRVTNLVEIVS